MQADSMPVVSEAELGFPGTLVVGQSHIINSPPLFSLSALDLDLSALASYTYEEEPEHPEEYFLDMAWVGGWFERTMN